MGTEFSEFSYGFALTHELANHSVLSFAPIFPSLIDEATLGWDLKIDPGGVPLFIQFKLSDNMVGSQAIAYKNHCLSLPYFRFKVRGSASSNQHNLLVNLNQTNSVYYAAPYFSKLKDFNNLFTGKKVALNSIFLPPKEIGVFGDMLDHQVCFSRHSSTAYVFSETRIITTSHSFDSFIINSTNSIIDSTSNYINPWEIVLARMTGILLQSGITVDFEGLNSDSIQKTVSHLAMYYFGISTFSVKLREERNDNV